MLEKLHEALDLPELPDELSYSLFPGEQEGVPVIIISIIHDPSDLPIFSISLDINVASSLTHPDNLPKRYVDFTEFSLIETPPSEQIELVEKAKERIYVAITYFIDILAEL